MTRGSHYTSFVIDQRLSRFLCLVLLLIAAMNVRAQAGGRGSAQPRRSGPGTGNPAEHLAPWKYLDSGIALPKNPITLVWFPLSSDDADRSRLMISRVLLESAQRCVALAIVLPNNQQMIEQLHAEKPPGAMIVDARGQLVRRLEAAQFRPEAVEKMVTAELAARDDRMSQQMADAIRNVGSGNREAAIAFYQRIWDDRCLFPLAGSEAQRALAKLGVIVKEPPAVAVPDPYLQPPATKTGH